MTLYESLRGTAQSLIRDYGDTLTLVKLTQGDYNPALGKVAEVNSTTTYGFQAILDSPQNVGAHVTNLLQLKAGDLILTVAQGALMVDIDPKDTILIGEDAWMVVAVDPPHSQDSVVVRTIQLRRKDS